MSDFLLDADSPYWQTRPADAFTPAFPIIGQSIPAPPPPPLLPASPPSVKHLALSTGIGFAVGTAITLCTVIALLGLLIFHGNLTHELGVSPHAPTITPKSRSAVSPSPTSAAPPAPAASKSQTPLPLLPLQVSAAFVDDNQAEMTMTTHPGATLIITVTYRNGTIDPIYNRQAIMTPTGSFSASLFPPHRNEKGKPPPGTVSVTAHLAGYHDTAASTPISHSGHGR